MKRWSEDKWAEMLLKLDDMLREHSVSGPGEDVSIIRHMSGNGLLKFRIAV